MASRIKQEEKNEKIIRGLLKLPANKKCINCNSLGPQYVCTNFWTFICTNCSGIHREFTHRVKSVSMAKFTSQEVTALQEGGNERAKEIFFKDWDLQRHSFPDSSNVDRLRTFIKHVYVDRRYSGDRSTDKPPRMKGDREDVSEHRKPETFRGPRSPSYDDAYDRRYGERRSPGGSSDDRNSRHSYEERRSPGYDQSDYRRSPSYFEVVDDRVRDDRLGKGNQNLRFEDRRISDGSSKTGVKSPNHQKDVGVSSPPTVRPVREILGEDAPALRIGEPPKANGGRVSEAPVQTQRSASSNSIVSSDGNPAEVNNASAVSLIDFDADPEPRAAVAPEISSSQQNTAPPVDSGNWASFDLGPEQKTATPPPPPPPANANSLESSLAQLYVSGNTQPVHNASNLQSFNTDASPKSGDAWPSALQGEVISASATISQTMGSQSIAPQSTAHAPGTSQSILQPIVQQSTPHAPGVGQMTVPQPMFPQSTSHTVVANNQSWVSSVGQGVGGPPASGNASQFMSTPVAGANPGVPLQPQPVEPKLNERKELPADLFAFTYPMGGNTYPSWQAQPQYGVGYGMQYPATMMPAAAAGTPPFSQPSRSANPFDVSTETTLAHASTMPPVASLPGALSSNMDPSGILRSSSLGASPSPQWTSQPQPPNSMLSIPGGYMPQIQGHMNQQSPANVFPMGNSVGGDFGNKVAYGLSGLNQNVNAQYSQPSASSFPSGGGNPFG